MIDQYLETRQRTEEICTPLKPEDYNAQVVLHASPAGWQLGHVTWFFEEFILSKHHDNYQWYRNDCAFIFNSYYNNVGDRTKRDKRDEIDFSIEEVYHYRKYVDKHIELLLNFDFPQEVLHLLEIGLNHEQQHQELLLTDLKFMLSQKKPNDVYKADGSLVHSTNTEDNWISVEEGVYEIGYEGDGFCYDNELARHKVYLHDFEISKALVTNGEFIEFMNAGGYEDFNLWLDEGWAWVQKEKIGSPLYWKQIDGIWHYFTLGGLKKVNPNDMLCHVSFYEAAAFAE